MEYFSYQISVLGVGVGVGQGRTRSHVRPCHFTTNMSDHVILQFIMSDLVILQFMSDHVILQFMSDPVMLQLTCQTMPCYN